jgi:hypothetical protein
MKNLLQLPVHQRSDGMRYVPLTHAQARMLGVLDGDRLLAFTRDGDVLDAEVRADGHELEVFAFAGVLATAISVRVRRPNPASPRASAASGDAAQVGGTIRPGTPNGFTMLADRKDSPRSPEEKNRSSEIRPRLVHGPYSDEDRGRWSIRVLWTDGTRESQYFHDEALAKAEVARLREQATGEKLRRGRPRKAGR